MNKLFEKIYNEKDIATNISIFTSVIIAVITYKIINDIYFSFLTLIGTFSLVKIISQLTIKNLNKKKFINNFSSVEKNAINLFVQKGTISILFSKIDTDKFDDGLYSLTRRGIIEPINQPYSESPIGLELSEDVFNKFVNN
jgi:hypothetical protein